MRFYTEGLLSKFGFDDGDQLDLLLSVGDVEEHHVLVEVVRQYVVPALHQSVTLQVVPTHHNPVRAATVNGDRVNIFRAEEVGRIKLTPEFVDVPDGYILAIAECFDGDQKY